MIGYLRKIRQKLIEENRVTRYIVYALGEILLVVIGKSSPFRDWIWVEENKQIINPPCL